MRCWLDEVFAALSRLMPESTRSSLNCICSTKNFSSPASSGSFHLRSISEAGVASGNSNNLRTSIQMGSHSGSSSSSASADDDDDNDGGEEEEEEEDGEDSAPTASSLPVLSLSSPAFSSTSSSMPPPPPPLSSTSFLSAAPTFSAFPSFVISSSESSSPSSPDPTALALKPFTSSSSSASAAPSASPSPLFTAEGRGALTEIAVSVVELLKVKPSCAFFFKCLASSLAAFSRRALAASGCSNPEGNGCLLRSKCFTSSSMLPCFFSILSAVLGPMPGILSQ
mmetsp:Transcript_13016/g.24124  ORF Transcript_13016/g.24124 Transcript_13016/m.24124 type:complete len:282 (-) Transcript_13016:781-1626(-)